MYCNIVGIPFKYSELATILAFHLESRYVYICVCVFVCMCVCLFCLFIYFLLLLAHPPHNWVQEKLQSHVEVSIFCR